MYGGSTVDVKINCCVDCKNMKKSAASNSERDCFLFFIYVQLRVFFLLV